MTLTEEKMKNIAKYKTILNFTIYLFILFYSLFIKHGDINRKEYKKIDTKYIIIIYIIKYNTKCKINYKYKILDK